MASTFSPTGNVAADRLVAVLRALATLKRTGSLTAHGSRGTKKVFFLDGDVVAVASAEADERLGHYLGDWGFITVALRQQLLDAQQASARGLGELAVARRLLDASAMSRLLRIRAEDALFDLARWDDGEYRFAAEQVPARAYLEMRLNIVALLSDLERLAAAWHDIGSGVPGPRDVPGVMPTLGFRTLSMTEADVLRQIDGRRTLAEVAIACRVSQLEVAVVLQKHARDGLLSFLSAPRRVTSLSADARWPELLREAEASLAMADLVEAHDHLCRALSTGDTSRELQDLAMAVEARIRAAVTVSERDTLAPASAGAGTHLRGAEARLLASLDGEEPLEAALDRLGGDRMRGLLVANALAQCGVVVRRERAAVE